MLPEVYDSEQILLVKIAAWLVQNATGGSSGVPGATGPTAVNSGGLAKSYTGKASAGLLYSATVFNNSASTLYFQLFDAAGLPANGTVPLMSTQLPPGTTGSLDYGSIGRPFATGIFAALSTTAATLTLTGSADGFFDYVLS